MTYTYKEKDMNSLELLPEYMSHKKVRAGKIIEATNAQAEPLVNLLLGCGITYCVDKAHFENRVMATDGGMNPLTKAVGGYWVWYEDGFESWSPAEAFEGGYTPVVADAPTRAQTQERQDVGNTFRGGYRPLTAAERRSVISLKDEAAMLWDVYESARCDGAEPRKIALAKTALEESVMWATKAITG